MNTTTSKQANTETHFAARRISDLPVGEFIRRKADAKKTYVRGEYDRSTKSYECHDTDDYNRSIFIKRNVLVFNAFTY